MQKVGIVVNPKKSGVFELVPKITEWLSKRDVRVEDSLAKPVDDVLKDASFAVCLGGDGTILSLSHYVRLYDVPVLGVNLGSLGFLTEVKEAELFEELSAALNGQFTVEERLMLSAVARDEKKRKERRLVALNDIVVSREGLSRILRLEVRVSGEHLTAFTGDGVIISTPTGSTAYSFSAGGGIVHPKVDAMLMTPICPHDSALRSMVFHSGEKFAIRIQKNNENCKALLTADGQENIEIDDSYIIEVTKAKQALKLIKSSKRSYLATLREKFKFPG